MSDDTGRELATIQKWNAVVLAVAIGFSAWRFGLRAAESVALGGAVGAANFWLTAQVVRRTFVSDENVKPSGGLLFLKFGGLFGGVAVTLWAFQPDSTGFAAGFVSVLPAVVLKAIVEMAKTQDKVQEDVQEEAKGADRNDGSHDL